MKNKHSAKVEARLRRQRRVRAKVHGTAARPRLSVFRSAGHIYAQLIDDVAGKTLASSSDLEMEAKEVAAAKKGTDERKGKVALSFAIGKDIAAKAAKKNVTTVVFDRNGFAYTGRVSALAEGAREGGLKF